MPSSISSSSDRLPTGPWGRTWVVALVLATATLAGVEAFWRMHGFRPTLIDDMDLWAVQRTKIPAGGDAIVLIGSSRNQAAIAVDVLRREMPGREVIQLSLSGGRPLATLRDLAEDEGFRGVVLCDLLPLCLLPEDREGQAPYVRYAHRSFNVARWIERTLKTAVQSCLVVNSTQLRPAFVFSAFYARKWPERVFFYIHADRSRFMDFRGVDGKRRAAAIALAARQTGYRVAVPPDLAGWQADIDVAERLVERIQARGGKVVYLSHPSGGEVRELEESHFPRARYWDALAARTKAAAVIRSEDVPALAGYVCPDGSHLDFRDAVPYTESLIAELRARGVFPPR